MKTENIHNRSSVLHSSKTYSPGDWPNLDKPESTDRTELAVDLSQWALWRQKLKVMVEKSEPGKPYNCTENTGGERKHIVWCFY